MKKIILMLLITICLVSCGTKKIETLNSDNYNQELFYENNLNQIGADPSVIYISEGNDAGYYYMYITSDKIEVRGYLAYRSKDLVNWEEVGTVFGYKKELKEDGNTYMTCGTTDYWAPEVIYDSNTKLYYLFYSANQYNAPKGEEYYFYGDIAISENPYGPFKQYREYYGLDAKLVDEKKKLYVYEPLFDFSLMDKNHPLYEKYTNGFMKIIDLSPFIDPTTGKKYLYFTRDLYNPSHANQSKIMVMELNDDYTPKYETVTQLTIPNKNTIDGEYNDNLKEGKTNEGSFTIYKDGKYYLLYSACSYMLKAYSIRLAVGDNPLGPFRKLNKDEGGMFLYADNNTSWIGATGHGSVVCKENDYYIVYHASQCRFNNEFNRAIAFDKIIWTKNNDGLLVPYANGPSYALLPLLSTGKNKILNDFQIDLLNNKNDVNYLKDGLIKFHDEDFVKECEFEKGINTISIKLDNEINLKAVMVFNSINKDLMLDSIKDIVVYSDGQKYHTGKIGFDKKRYLSDLGFVIPGGSFSALLNGLKTNEIEIEISQDKEYALSEIMLIY